MNSPPQSPGPCARFLIVYCYNFTISHKTAQKPYRSRKPDPPHTYSPNSNRLISKATSATIDTKPSPDPDGHQDPAPYPTATPRPAPTTPPSNSHSRFLKSRPFRSLTESPEQFDPPAYRHPSPGVNQATHRRRPAQTRLQSPTSHPHHPHSHRHAAAHRSPSAPPGASCSR